MSVVRGQRQAERSKQALTTAFAELLHRQSYQSITIQAITERANTGRSTFYRHFQSKADVLVEMHKEFFTRLALGALPASHLPTHTPSPRLVRMLTLFKEAGAFPVSLTSLGADADYVFRQISLLLCQSIEEKLHDFLTEAESAIPLALLAQAMTGVYIGLLRGVLETPATVNPEQLAKTIERLNGALLREAGMKG